MKKIIAATLMTASFSAFAAFESGNKLFEYLSSTDQTKSIYALGYISGIHDVGEGIFICTTSAVTLKQLKDVVLNKLINNPAERHKSADVFVYSALTEAFPCAKKKST